MTALMRLRAAWAAAGHLVRRISGMPDYAAYCAHLRSAHPERPLPDERTFFAEYLARRYGGGPSRCC